MPAFVIYARKSSEDEDRQVLSIPAQVAELRALADARGLTVVETLEEARSARTPGRPTFARMMDMIERGRVTGVLCWKPDRLARNMVDGGRLIDALDRGRLVEIVEPSRTHRNTSDDKFMLGLAFTMSKKFVDDLSDNVRRGNRAVLQSGRCPGQVPLGYAKEARDDARGTGAGRTVIDPERFPLVRELFQRYLTGAYTVPELHRIAAQKLGLRARGNRRYPSAPLGLTAVYKMLGNPFYAGMIRRRGEVWPGAHEAMISQQQFTRIQQLLRRDDARRPSRHDFTYAGTLRCGSCGRAVVGEEHWNRRYGRRYVYYRCPRKRPGYAICAEPYAREEEIDTQIVAALRDMAIPSWVLEWTFERLAAGAADEIDTSRAAAASLRATLASTEAELERLTRLCTRGVLSEDEYVRERMRLLGEIDSLRRRVRDPAGPVRLLEQQMRHVFTSAAAAADAFSRSRGAERRELLGELCERVFLQDRGVRLSLRKPFALIAGAWRAKAPDGSNHEPGSENSLNRAETGAASDATRHATDDLETGGGSNHDGTQRGKRKTATLSAAVSRWQAIVHEVRMSLLVGDSGGSANAGEGDIPSGRAAA